jgi:hypothetical protein
MNQALVVFAVLISLIAALIAGSIPTKVYSQLQFVPSSPPTLGSGNARITSANNTSSSLNATIASGQIKLNGNHWGIENATADFQNGASYNPPYNSCNFKRDGPEFCDAYMHAYDITWNMLKDKARNEHLRELVKNDKGFQEMIK